VIFLIHYDRPRGTIVKLERFSAQDRERAGNERLLIEIDLSRRGLQQQEVVLLEAENEGVLRKTHHRYFGNVQQIVTSSSG